MRRRHNYRLIDFLIQENHRLIIENHEIREKNAQLPEAGRPAAGDHQTQEEFMNEQDMCAEDRALGVVDLLCQNDPEFVQEYARGRLFELVMDAFFTGANEEF